MLILIVQTYSSLSKSVRAYLHYKLQSKQRKVNIPTVIKFNVAGFESRETSKQNYVERLVLKDQTLLFSIN